MDNHKLGNSTKQKTVTLTDSFPNVWEGKIEDKTEDIKKLLEMLSKNGTVARKQ